MRLVDGAQIDLLLTDPPYGVAYEAKAGKIQNDDLSADGLADLLMKSLQNAAEVMRPGGCYYIWMGNKTLPVLLSAMGEAGLSYRQLLVWVKNQAPLSRLDYHANHEVCVEAESNADADFAAYGWTDGDAHTFRYDRKQKTVLEFPKPQRNSLHPTMKPVPLFDYQIKANTRPGDNVLDLFAGSGTTLIACQQNGRNAYLMELDPKYADRIIERWEAFTGMKAERIE